MRMQPGRPVVFGRMPRTASQQVSKSASQQVHKAKDGWTYFFGLPGNPVSTQVTFHCFVGPMLRAICGAGVAGPRFVQATLAEEMQSGKDGLTRILPAILRHDLERPAVELCGRKGLATWRRTRERTAMRCCRMGGIARLGM